MENNDKYITLDQNIDKYTRTLKAIKVLEEIQGYHNTNTRSGKKANRANKSHLKNANKNLKRLAEVIKKQSKLKL